MFLRRYERYKSGKRHMKGCGRCHKTTANALKTGHKLCVDCHRAKRAPVNCDSCHPKQQTP